MKNNSRYLSDDKAVNPDHYKNGEFEVIDLIAAGTRPLRGVLATDVGNVMKYILRYRNKDGVRDLKKALWYSNDAVNGDHNIDSLCTENLPSIFMNFTNGMTDPIEIRLYTAVLISFFNYLDYMYPVNTYINDREKMSNAKALAQAAERKFAECVNALISYIELRDKVVVE